MGYRPEKERQDFLLHWDHSLVGKGNTVKQNQITSACKQHEDITAGCETKEHQGKGRQGHQWRPLWLANLLRDDLWAGPPWPPSVWLSTSISSNQSAYVFLITGLGSWVHKWLLLAPKDEKKSLYSKTKGDFSFFSLLSDSIKGSNGLDCCWLSSCSCVRTTPRVCYLCVRQMDSHNCCSALIQVRLVEKTKAISLRFSFSQDRGQKQRL